MTAIDTILFAKGKPVWGSDRGLQRALVRGDDKWRAQFGTDTMAAKFEELCSMAQDPPTIPGDLSVPAAWEAKQQKLGPLL